MQHPEGAAFMVSLAKRARKHRLGLQFITQDVQDLLSEDSSRTITGHSGRALLQNAAFKLLLQQDAAAISTVRRRLRSARMTFNAGCCRARVETGCCWRRDTDSPSASRPRRRRRQ